MNTKILSNILLIDDDEPTNFYHSLMIEESGVCLNIHVKDSAVEALEWLKNDDNPIPDLIFLDINMPIMNGWEFLEEYRALPDVKKSNIVVIMLTTSLNPNDMEKAKQMKEISSFMNKPLTIENIKNLVNEQFALT